MIFYFLMNIVYMAFHIAFVGEEIQTNRARTHTRLLKELDTFF